MMKHTQKILPTNYLSAFDHFVELALKGLKVKETYDDSFMKVAIPCAAQRPQALKYVNDSYRKISSKNNASANRGEITKTGVCGKFLSKNVPMK